MQVPNEGWPCKVVEAADFTDLVLLHGEWHAGVNHRPHVIGRLKRHPNKFKAFRSKLDVPNSWEIVDGVAEVWSTW